MAGTVQIRKSPQTTRSSATVARRSPAPSTTARPSGASDSVSLSSEARQGNAHSDRTAGLMAGLGQNFGTTEASGFGGQNTSAGAIRAARRVHHNHQGNEPLDLSNRRDVGRLISRTPQHDNLRSTNDDRNRCGGAAIMNAMLLDGDHEHNAQALRGLVQDRQRQGRFGQMSEQQTEALQAMENGNMTPSQAAQLQELTYDVANAQDGQRNRGLNNQDMTTTVAELRQRGAFPNTEEMNFRREHTYNSRGAANGSHWTVSTRNRNGAVNYADSAPRENGYATVTGREGASFAPQDHGNERPMASSVVYRRNGGGSNQEMVNRWPGEDGYRQQSWEISGPRAGHTDGEQALPPEQWTSN